MVLNLLWKIKGLVVISEDTQTKRQILPSPKELLRWRYTNETSDLIFTKGIADVPNGAMYTRVNKEYYVQVAGLTINGLEPDPIGRPRFPTSDGDFSLEPGTLGRPDPGIVIECVGADADTAYFPAANINCTAIAQGVNSITAVTCSRDLII